MATQSNVQRDLLRRGSEIREKVPYKTLNGKMAEKGLSKIPDLDQDLEKISRKGAQNSNSRHSRLFNTAENHH